MARKLAEFILSLFEGPQQSSPEKSIRGCGPGVLNARNKNPHWHLNMRSIHGQGGLSIISAAFEWRASNGKPSFLKVGP